MSDFLNPLHDSDKTVSQLIKDMTGGLGVDYCFECTGLPRFINEALEATKLGKGKAIAVRTLSVTSLQISHLALLCGRTLKGSIFGGLKTKTDVPFDKCKNKEIRLDELLTHEVQPENMSRAFQLLEQEDCVKVLIKI